MLHFYRNVHYGKSEEPSLFREPSVDQITDNNKKFWISEKEPEAISSTHTRRHAFWLCCLCLDDFLHRLPLFDMLMKRLHRFLGWPTIIRDIFFIGLLLRIQGSVAKCHTHSFSRYANRDRMNYESLVSTTVYRVKSTFSFMILQANFSKNNLLFVHDESTGCNEAPRGQVSRLRMEAMPRLWQSHKIYENDVKFAKIRIRLVKVDKKV